MPDIFISYSRRDIEFARWLTASLEARGADVWFDHSDIRAGIKWSSAIQQGLRDSRSMVVIISPESMASPNVEDEWQWFLDRKKPLIPVLLKPADIHFQLSRIQYIDFAHQDYDAAFEQLIVELEGKGVTFTPQPMPQKVIHQPTASIDRRPAIFAGVLVLVTALLIISWVLLGNQQAATNLALTQTVLNPTLTPVGDARAMNAAFAITAAFEGVDVSIYKSEQWNSTYTWYPNLRALQAPLSLAMIFDIRIQYGLPNAYLDALNNASSELSEEERIITLASQRGQVLIIDAERQNNPVLRARAEFWHMLISSSDWQLQGDVDGNLVVNGQIIQVSD